MTPPATFCPKCIWHYYNTTSAQCPVCGAPLLGTTPVVIPQRPYIEPPSVKHQPLRWGTAV